MIELLISAVSVSVGMAIGLNISYGNHTKRHNSAEKRDTELKSIYDSLEKQWSEQNNATNFSVMFEQVLNAMPKEALKSNATLSIFEDELEIAVGNITRDEQWSQKTNK